MTKEELQQYRWLKRNLDRLEEKVLELEAEATRCTPILSDDPKSGSSDQDKMSKLVGQMVDIKELIKRNIAEGYVIVQRIEMAIDALPEKEKYLIRKRYIDLKSWEEIAVDMCYSWRQIHNIHSNALILLNEKSAHHCTSKNVIIVS